jgi:anti-anti-sigma factor
VDLRDVSFMDSTGIYCLLQTKAPAAPLGRRMALLNGSREARRVLELTGLLGAFEFVEELGQLTT